MLHTGYTCDIIDVVVDVYYFESIKPVECIQRCFAHGISSSSIMPAWSQDQEVITVSENKLIVFLAETGMNVSLENILEITACFHV